MEILIIKVMREGYIEIKRGKDSERERERERQRQREKES